MKIKVEYGNAWDRLSGDEATILYEHLSRRLEDLEWSGDENDTKEAERLTAVVDKLFVRR